MASNRLRVLLVSHTCQSKTEGQPKAELLAKFPDIDLKVLVPHRWKHYGEWRKADVESDSSLFHVGRVLWPWMGPAQFYLHWYPSLRKLIREFQPHIVDLWEEPWGLVSAHTVRLRNRLFPKTRIISETEQNLNRQLPPPFEQFRTYTLKHADYLIGRSSEAVELARLKGFSGPACTVPNAVDNSLFIPMDRSRCRQELGWNQDQFIAGYMGRLVERKGLKDLVEAAVRCDRRVAIAFVGDGEMNEWLRLQALRPELAGRLHMLAGRPLADLPMVMNALDVMALPSRTVPTWKEQFGRVIIEAHACRVPVIGSDSGAIPEVIEQGGIVFHEGDVEELSRGLNRMANAPDLCLQMGEAGYQQVMEKYTWQKVAERMAGIYREVHSRAALRAAGAAR